MATTAGSLIPEGRRVRVKRGPYPLDPDIVGRTGTVMDATPYRARSYAVVLDGSSDPRMFAREELEAIEPPELFAPDRKAAKRRLPLP